MVRKSRIRRSLKRSKRRSTKRRSTKRRTSRKRRSVRKIRRSLKRSTKRRSSRKRSSRKRRSVRKIRRSQKRSVERRRSQKRSVERRRSQKRSKKSRKKSKDCIKRSDLKLLKNQKKVVKFINDDDHHSLLIAHGTGCGKTLSAVTASQCYLDKNPGKSVVLVAPTSLIKNFEKELKAYGVTNREKYELYTYTKFATLEKDGQRVDCTDKMLILDEAHQVRNFKNKKKGDENQTRDQKLSPRYLSTFKCSEKTDKTILLTATPYINSLTDFIPIINLLYGEEVVGNMRDYQDGIVSNYISSKLTDENIGIIKSYLQNKVDYLECGGNKYFPKVKEHFINVKMSEEYKTRYDSLLDSVEIDGIIFDEPAPFFNAHRRAVNMAGEEYLSLKLTKILPKLVKKKSVIFTNWIDFGVEPIKKLLDSKGVSHKEFHGGLSQSKRNKIVNEFNKGDFQVLIITKAGGEGLDLKGVRNVILLDPVWHQSGYEQIIGRAARYKSHEHLPKSKRKVDVYKLVLISPEFNDWEDEAEHSQENLNSHISGDVALYRILEKKKLINEEISVMLNEISI